jgi:hypothetical protein
VAGQHLRSHLLKVGNGRGQGICFHHFKAHIARRTFFDNHSIALDIAKPRNTVHAMERDKKHASGAAGEELAVDTMSRGLLYLDTYDLNRFILFRLSSRRPPRPPLFDFGQ